MISIKKLFVLTGLILCNIQLEACRFTIREIGYSDLCLEQYKLVLNADAELHKTVIDDFKRLAFAYLLDANVNDKVLQSKVLHPKLSFLRSDGSEIYSREVKNTNDIIDGMTTCLSSPVRQHLLREMGNVFSLILYFEAKDSNINDYQHIIEEATAQFKHISPHLDKAVNEGIKVIKVAFSNRQKETVLMKALGVSVTNKQACVAILYGRGRLAGQVLHAKKLTAKTILDKLVLIGTDCECGIDLSPILERALPLNRPDGFMQQTTDMLGFDVSNPMILAEMSRILAKSAANTKGDKADFKSGVFGLKKTIDIEKNRPDNVLFKSMLVLMALAVVVLAVGLLIYWRKK